MPDTDPVADLLRKAPLTNKQRAELWDAYYESDSPEAFEARVKDMKLISGNIRPALWDLKAGETPQDNYSGGDKMLENVRNVGRTVTNALPVIGGAVGGAVGGVPGAAIGGAAGAGLKQVAQRLPEIPGAVADVARNLAQQPGATMAGAGLGAIEGAQDAATQAAINGGAQGAGVVIGKGMAWAGPRLMQSALKPTAAVLKEYGTTAKGLVKNLLDEGVNVTENGLAKLQMLFDANNKEIAAAIADRDAVLSRLTGVPGANAVVDKKRVAARTLETAGRMAQQTNPTRDLRAVGKTAQEFLDHPVYTGNMTLPEAQAMKVGTYQQIGKKYGEVSSASIEAQKALARGLKEEIAAEVPGVSALNQRDSALMASMDAVGRRIALSGNRDPVGFAWVAQNPVTFLAALMDRQPVVKSMLARGMYDNAARVARVTPDAIRLAVGAIAQTGSGERDAAPPQE